MFLLALAYILPACRAPQHKCFAADRKRHSTVVTKVGLFLALFSCGQLVPVIELLCSCRGITGGKEKKELSGHQQEEKGRSGTRCVQHIVLDCDLFL